MIDDVITNFDGNDVIGLFENNVLIDTLGDLGVMSTYIQNNTLAVRPFFDNSNPNWDMFSVAPNGPCIGFIGYVYYVYLLSTSEVETNTFQMYPNPATGNTLQFNTKNNQTIDSVTIIDINGRNIFTSTTILNNQLSIQNIKQGIYFVKIESENKTSIHKLIRQ